MKAAQVCTSDGPALALETSSYRASVVVGRGQDVLAERALSSQRRHAAELLPTIDELCREQRLTPADLRAVFVSRGPGSFTGLRIGITVARMLAFDGQVTLVGVPTLEALAWQVGEAVTVAPARVVTLLDAGRGMAYGQTFGLRGEVDQDARADDGETRSEVIDGHGLYLPLDEPAELEPAAYLKQQSIQHATVVTGEGVAAHHEATAAVFNDHPHITPTDETLHRPTAAAIYALGRQRLQAGLTDDPRRIVPLYIRKAAAEEKWEKMHGG